MYIPFLLPDPLPRCCYRRSQREGSLGNHDVESLEDGIPELGVHGCNLRVLGGMSETTSSRSRASAVESSEEVIVQTKREAGADASRTQREG